jgi:hypothetical protein
MDGRAGVKWFHQARIAGAIRINRLHEPWMVVQP